MRRLTLTALGTLAFAAALPASAQGVCDERQTFLDQLAQQYEEAPVAMGLASNGGVVEVLRSEKGSTWTILITLPDGKSCMIAAGESWEDLDFLPPGPSV